MRIALFGASKAGEFFLQKNPHLNIVAIADNDAARHGKVLNGIPIIDPATLRQASIDKVIITSQWVDAIRTQLTDELGFTAAEIDTPSKQQVKASQPFMHAPTLALAHQVLIALQRFLRRRDIPVCLDSGTLLGALREQDLIAWDDDIDLAIDADDFERLRDVMPDFFTQLPEPSRIDWQLTVISVNNRDCCINIEFTPKSPQAFVPFDISLQMRETHGDTSELVSSAGLFFAPAHHFTHFDEIAFLNETFYIPHDADAFLTFMYGNWREPKRETRITEYQNRRAKMAVTIPTPIVTKRTLGPVR